MASSMAETMRRSPFPSSPRSYTTTGPSRPLPVLSVSKPSISEGEDAMDIVQSASTSTSMGPPPVTPASEARQSDISESAMSNTTMPVGAAAAAQQPKIVQTAFIHKLYNMLEDQTIQHLISWSNTNESFVMSPSSEFSKVLAQYFKHTNISSFVRQLNMYGFHKVSDVFHTGSPDSPLWEFKHGGGNFKRGDLVGLREIKRRASRHALIHRDSFSTTPKIPAPPQISGTLPEPMQDPIETRFAALEWQQQDLVSRLYRSEEAYAGLNAKYQTLLDGLHRCYGWNKDLTSSLSTILPASETQIHRDLASMQHEIARGIESLREETHDPFMNVRQSLFASAMHADAGVSVSPRQRPYDDSRRPSLQNIARPATFRSALPSHVQASPRRYGSFSNGAYSPSTTNTRTNYALPPPAPPVVQAPIPHPPPTRTQSPPPFPNLSRRHTSADIRTQGWQGGPLPPYNQANSPYASGQNSSAWPSSPRTNANPDQQIRDALASYDLPRASQVGSRQTSPPAPDAGPPTFTNSFASTSPYANTSNEAGWQLPGPKYPFKNLDTPGPPTRRSSMASNVHSLLNPADTAERDDEDEVQDDRKRKRVL